LLVVFYLSIQRGDQSFEWLGGQLSGRVLPTGCLVLIAGISVYAWRVVIQESARRQAAFISGPPAASVELADGPVKLRAEFILSLK
jgi:hypothetical protein